MTGSPEPHVGELVKAVRLSGGLSIRQLAERSGCSASSISQIERGIVEPRLGTLMQIVSAMGLTVAQLLSEQSVVGRPQRDADRPAMVDDAGHRELPLTRRPLAHFDAYRIELGPSGESAQHRITHGDSQELVYVLSGELRLELGDEVHVLTAGDSIEYQSSTPHRFSSHGGLKTELIWVASPPIHEPKTEVIDS